MNKDGLLSGNENEIGLPGKPGVVEDVSKPRFVRDLADDHFWLRIATTYRSHITTSLGLSMDVCHDEQTGVCYELACHARPYVTVGFPYA